MMIVDTPRLLADAVIVGAVGLYVWVLASQLHTPLISPIQRWLRRGWRRGLVGCPYCFGFWVSAALAVVLEWGRWGPVTTPAVALAGAALIGVVGSNFTPGIGDEEE